MNETEKKIREIAVFLINAQTIEGVAEAMNRIAVLIDGHGDTVATYFTGLYNYIDDADKAFHPLLNDESRVKRIGAKLLLSPTSYNAVTALVRLHHVIGWAEGENAMIEMSDKLWNIAEKDGTPSFD